VPARAGAQQERPGTEAERLYGAGRFQEAYDAFHRLAEKEGPSPTLSYDMGNSLYRMGRYDTAVGSYREALADSSGIRAESAFNLGNSLFKAAESRPEGRDDLRRAVTAYEDALVLAPRDADAKWNLELALRRLQQEEQQQARGGGGGGGGGGSGQQQASEGEGERREGGGEQGARKGPSPSQGEAADQGRTPSTAALTREQARQLLDAIQSEEGEALDRGDEGRARAASVGRDW
jgi:Ca-activated chloride channel family protein